VARHLLPLHDRFEFDGSNSVRPATAFEKSQGRTKVMETSEKAIKSSEFRERRMTIEQQAYSLVDSHCHFHRRAGRFEFHCDEDVLIVRGNVPTFYLKQLLQCVLQDVEGVRSIDNQVIVISGQGLSGSSD
jgi:hypothetical protein